MSKFEELVDQQLEKARDLVNAGTPKNMVYAEIMKGAKPAPKPETKPMAPVKPFQPRLGSATAPVKLQLFADLECPFCARLFPTLLGLEKKYSGKLAIVWFDLPLPFHTKATRNARAARAMEEARRELESLDANRKIAAEQELAEIDRQISTAQIDADAAKTSIEQLTGVPAELAAKGTETELVYTIMRNKQGQSTSVDATETSRLEPGDVVRISVRPRSPTEPASSQQRAENQAN